MPDPKAPRGTGAAGRALWRSIVGTYELEVHERVVLGQLVKVADRIAALDSIVDEDGVLVDGRAHPALIESRLQRLTLARLLTTLRLPDQRPQRRGLRGVYSLDRARGLA
ncbi:MAG TPA: hypothetical protein VE645_07445 [Pseudonocardiaceae bacterium]|jgi:hypothetical protein|nr:hypothetical protein [Pseudonocardiaceae bacterium]